MANNHNNYIAIKELIKEKILTNHFILAIDGPCGGGKSTLASELEKELGYNVVHMDDFYLPFKDRSETWTTTIAGHMDFERLINNVLIPYKEHNNTNYISYDCHSDKYLNEIFIDLDKPLILEGSYSLHPKLDNFIDIKVFVDIDNDTQIKRLMKRNEKTVDLFRTMWIPFENKYFNELKIKDSSDLILYV